MRNGTGGKTLRYATHENVDPFIAHVVSRRLATLKELEEYYGTEDLFDMLEIIAVDDNNQAVANEANNG